MSNSNWETDWFLEVPLVPSKPWEHLTWFTIRKLYSKAAARPAASTEGSPDRGGQKSFCLSRPFSRITGHWDSKKINFNQFKPPPTIWASANFTIFGVQNCKFKRLIVRKVSVRSFAQSQRRISVIESRCRAPDPRPAGPVEAFYTRI